MIQRNDGGPLGHRSFTWREANEERSLATRWDLCIKRDQRIPDFNVTCRTNSDQRQLTVRYRQSRYEQESWAVIHMPHGYHNLTQRQLRIKQRKRTINERLHIRDVSAKTISVLSVHNWLSFINGPWVDHLVVHERGTVVSWSRGKC